MKTPIAWTNLRNSAGIAVVSALMISCGGSKEAMTDAAVLSNQITDATIWYAESAENEYLYLQLYSYAQQIVDQKTGQDGKRPRAVVLDLDETVLDNTPYQYRMIAKGETFTPETWNQWVNEARAEALPGALDFVTYCQEVGVEVYYISNRDQETLTATIRNLEALGFPNADEEHVLLKLDSSDKTERRGIVADKYEIILFLGDQLTDFNQMFDNPHAEERSSMVRAQWEAMRYSFILFPNPMYGGWMDPVLKGADTDKKKLKNKTNFINNNL